MQIQGMQFSYYSLEEAEKLCVKQITDFTSFDSSGHALKGGLYDPQMGLSPYDKSGRCETCGNSSNDCEGHAGIIKLTLPIYNPFLMKILLKLLKSKCYSCQRLRINVDKLKYLKNYCVLIKLGYIQEANEYMEFCNNQKIQKNDVNNQSTDQSEIDKQNNIKAFKQDFQQRISSLLDLKQQSEQKQMEFPQINTNSFENFLKQFFNSVKDTCPYCKVKSLKVKKEGYIKFFLVGNENEINTTKQVTTSKKQGLQQEKILTKDKEKKSKYMTPQDVKDHLEKTWKHHETLLNVIFGTLNIDKNTKKGYSLQKNGYQMFFTEHVIIQPNRFRPENKMGSQTFLHSHTVTLSKLIQINQELKSIMQLTKQKEQDEKNKNKKNLQDIISKWVELQQQYNGFLDSAMNNKYKEKEQPGIRQLLEKKDGLFRMKMMGKRVNFAARSVISPDPNLNTNEVGVPLFMAKKLTFPEYVNEHNLQQLQKMIINGPEQHPGANSIKVDDRLINLQYKSVEQRQGIADSLLNNSQNKIIYRHLINGDAMLFNRQPTLHKPSIMSHVVRVLHQNQTIRQHYVNCKSYNSDFDGDEMNLHFLQSQLARSECYNLALNDKQYIKSSDGKPIRELMQDSIIAAVQITMRDSFFNKQQFQMLIYNSVSNIFDNQVHYRKGLMSRITLVAPAIIKPRELWTGKQLLTNIMKIIGNWDMGINLQSKAKLSTDEMNEQDLIVIVKDNELLSGIVDKAQIGSGAEFGLMHAFYELYGSEKLGMLFSAFSRLFTTYNQVNGFTIGLDDIIVDHKELSNEIQDIHRKVLKSTANEMLGIKKVSGKYNLYNRRNYDGDFNYKENNQISESDKITQRYRENFILKENFHRDIDNFVRGQLGNNTKKVIDNTLDKLIKKFPQNNFRMITQSGAKGSRQNHIQVSAMLGQQELEGARVPVMPSGKTLPCFLPYDPNPRCGGFVADGFLRGLRLQEFYFHTMAGREGLLDTTIKTSRSGYLQRCLIKHLEGLKVHYDCTVRDADNGIIQFYYGEDGVETEKQNYLYKFDFLQNNYKELAEKYQVKKVKQVLSDRQVNKFLSQNIDNKKQILSNFRPGVDFGAVCTKAIDLFEGYFHDFPDRQKYKDLHNVKYIQSLISPGEAVGCIAAQAVGEPSTQMTLNTFHNAGHGAVNLTLGVPRLREILITATDQIKTPVMTLEFKENTHIDTVKKYQQYLKTVTLENLIEEFEITEEQCGEENLKQYNISLKIKPEDDVIQICDLDYKSLLNIINKQFEFKLDTNLEKYKSINNKQQLQQIKMKKVTKTITENESDVEDIFDDKKVKKQNFLTNETEEEKTIEFRNIVGKSFENNNYKIIIKVKNELKRLVILNNVQQLLRQTIIHKVKNISSSVILTEEQPKYKIQTNGVNFQKIFNLDDIQQEKIDSNDVAAICKTFGIEAARQTIINEVHNVFSVYKVTVNFRHLSLIADYMCFSGKLKAMNRAGMEESISPLLQITYETCSYYLNNACLFRKYDNSATASSQIVMGQTPKFGTGFFDVFYNFK